MCVVRRSLRSFPFDVTGRLCYGIVALPGHILNYFTIKNATGIYLKGLK